MARKGQFATGNPGKPKGAKNKDTVQKEILLSSLWDNTSSWVTGPGLTRFMAEMESMQGQEYVRSYLSLLEYFKPKLARVDNAFPDSEEVEIIRIKSKQKIEAKN